MNNKYDITIAYRCYPKISKTPKYWESNKLEMIKWWLKSLVLLLWDLKAVFYIIADWIQENWKEEIISVLWNHKVIYIYTNSIWNAWTWNKQIELLLEQDYSDIVYFAEDDYLYNISDNAWLKEWISLLKDKKADFVSLFDHLAIYKNYLHKYKKDFIITENKIRKTEASTCLTFMTTKKTLKETKKIFDLYTRWCWDYPMWTILTKKNNFRLFDVDYNHKLWLPWNKKPSLIQKLLKNFPYWTVCFFMSRIYWAKHILFWKKYRLFIPTPSIATHLESEDIAPLINWDDVFKKL